MLRPSVLFQDDLVCGTYVAWDDSMGPLHDSIPRIPYMNLYPCQNPADPNMHVSICYNTWLRHAYAYLIYNVM
jgi:hypothetical protein